MKIRVGLLVAGLALSTAFKTPVRNLTSQDQQNEELVRINQLNAEVVRLFRQTK
jgi:hypothetical protein